MIPGRPEKTALDDAWDIVSQAPPLVVAQVALPEVPPEAPAVEPAPVPAIPDAPPGPPPPDIVPAAGAAPAPDGQPAAPAPEPAAPQAAAQAADGATDIHTVGVVFVHGIGSQLAGETLFDWAGPLVRTLWTWAEDTSDPDGRPFRDPVEIAEVDLSGATTPIIELRVPSVPGHDEQRWVLTEAWWAADIRPPSVSGMIEWLFGRRQTRRILTGIVGGLRTASDRKGGDPLLPDGPPVTPKSRGLIDVVDYVGISALFFLLAVVVVPVYGILRLLAALPIPKVSDAISTAQVDLFLREWFGDVRILLGDRAQAANLRKTLATAILKLRVYGADSIVVVGHSGGTILSYMLLADPEYDDLDVDKFISHGQALGLAWHLGFRGEKVSPAYDLGLRQGDRLLANAHHPRPDATPSRLRWVDFHATHDPAPAFSATGWPVDLEPGGDGPDERWTVVNRGSVKNDHGGYWDNDEQFVIPLMRELDTPGATGASSRFYPEVGYQRDRVVRRMSRVAGLNTWWTLWMVLLAIALIGGAVVALATGGGLSTIGEWLGDLVRTWPLVGFIADLPHWIVGAIVIVVVFTWHGTSAVGAWNELDIEERGQARHLIPAHVSRATVRGRFVLFLVACIVLAATAMAPSRVTAILAVGAALLPRLPDAFARAFSFAGGLFDPAIRVGEPTPADPTAPAIDTEPTPPAEPAEPAEPTGSAN